MKLSEVNPVKFFKIGEEYVIPDYIKNELFVQEWRATDKIKLQICDDEAKTYRLRIVKEGVVFYSKLFEPVEIGNKIFYNVEIIPESIGLTGCFKLEISVEFFEVSGTIEEILETVSGDIEAANSLNINGAIVEGTESINSDIIRSVGSIFGIDDCILDTVLYWSASEPFGTGVTLYTDPQLSVPYTHSGTIAEPVNGDIYSLSFGVVGSLIGNCNEI